MDCEIIVMICGWHFFFSEIAHHRIENRIILCTRGIILGNMFLVVNIHCVYCVTMENVLPTMDQSLNGLEATGQELLYSKQEQNL